MKTDLKLGSLTVEQVAEYMGAELLTLSENAPTQTIELFTDEFSEIAKNTLFIVDADNSLAEMMAVAKKGALCVLCTKAPSSLDKIADIAVLVCDNIPDALERFAKHYLKHGKHRTIALTGAKGKTRTG